MTYTDPVEQFLGPGQVPAPNSRAQTQSPAIGTTPMPLGPTRFTGVPTQSTNPSQAAANLPTGGADPATTSAASQSDPSSSSKTKQVSPEQQLINQWNELTKTLLSSQVDGPQASALAAKLAAIANQLPYTTAQGLLKKLPQNTSLAGYVTQYMQNPSAATQGATQPTSAYDPLALQTMWHDVFGPQMKDALAMMKGTGQDYTTAMNTAIAGSNLPANQQAQLKAQSAATGAMMQQLAGSQYGAAVTGPSYDQMINWLQQATGAAQLAQGEYEKNVSYGQTAPLLGSSASPVSVPGITTPGASTVNALLGGGGTTTPATSSQSTNPFAPKQLP